jgi:hypothetical protein
VQGGIGSSIITFLMQKTMQPITPSKPGGGRRADREPMSRRLAKKLRTEGRVSDARKIKRELDMVAENKKERTNQGAMEKPIPLPVPMAAMPVPPTMDAVGDVYRCLQ